MAEDAKTRLASKKIGFTERVARFIWGDLDTYVGKDGEVHQIERALGAIRGLAILGLIPVMIFGAVTTYCAGAACTPFWIWGDYLLVLRGMSVAALAAVAAFAVGGILGFLFGVPRWGEAPAGQVAATQPAPPAQATPSPTPSPTVSPPPGPVASGAGADAITQPAKPQEGTAQPASASPTTQAASGSAAGAAFSGRVRPNTGLEKVMDWLTTLIVGLGLVHLRDAIDYMRKTSEWVTAAIAGYPGLEPPTNFAAGAAILVPYTIAGFLLVYLWAQRYMGREMALAEQESLLLQHMKEQAKVAAKEESDRTRNEVARISETLFNLAPLAAESMVPIAQRIEDSTTVSTSSEALSGVDPTIVDDIVKRYASAHDYMDEPLRGFGPVVAAGMRIEAEVRRLSHGIALFEVALVVSATSSAEPLTTPVVFLLHHSLPNPVRRVQPENNMAKLSVLSAGSFVAGAVVGKDIKLALDLTALPDVPQDFRDN